MTDTELDQAFADAEPDADEVIDADRVAREAIDQADRELVSEVVGSPDSSFATQTMAELLELQGEAAGASRIRASLESAPPEQMLPPAVSHGDRVLRTLEQWLANLERPR